MDDSFLGAVREIQEEKNLDETVVIDAFSEALEQSCRKDFGIVDEFDVDVTIDIGNNQIDVLAEKEVVRDPFDPTHQVTLEEAREHDPEAELGERVWVPLDLSQLSRTATQDLKQIMQQNITIGQQRDQHEEFKDQVLELHNGIIQRVREKTVYVRLGQDVEAILPYREQVEADDYSVGNRMKFLLVKVSLEDDGQKLVVVVSRSHPVLVERLFELHIPEVHDGLVEIMDVAREAGRRSKVAVKTNDPSLDPIGTCVGPQGSRIQSIVQEINGEKIDIIPYHEKLEQFIENALSPAEVSRVNLVEEENTAQVVVPDDQLSLAIGKGGQNARLTAKLVDWSIDVYGEREFAALHSEEAYEVAARLFKGSDELTDEFDVEELEGIGPKTAAEMEDRGLDDPQAILEKGQEELEKVPGIGSKTAESVVEQVRTFVQRSVAEEPEEEPAVSPGDTAEEIKQSIFKDADEEPSTDSEEPEEDEDSSDESEEPDPSEEVFSDSSTR